MSNPMLAIAPVGSASREDSACAHLIRPFGAPSPQGEGFEIATTAKRSHNDSFEGADDTMYLRLLEEKAKNRVMGVQLECANALLRVREEKREAKKRVRKAALKLLGWFGFGLAWGVLAVACSVFCPWWTCIAPVCLMLAAWWKAGGEV